MSGQASKALAFSATRRHLAAQGRRRAVLCRQPVLRLRLHRLDCLHLLSPARAILPRYEWAGFVQYVRLWNTPRWYVALENLLIFGGLFMIGCLVIGIFLAILLDQRIRAEGALRTIYLYPHGALLHRYRHGLEVDPQSHARP